MSSLYDSYDSQQTQINENTIDHYFFKINFIQNMLLYVNILDIHVIYLLFLHNCQPNMKKAHTVWLSQAYSTKFKLEWN